MHDNIIWTLSVYSLENRPVKDNGVLNNSEVFHFMVYDWSKTIKQLLEDQKIPYSILGFFTLDNIFNIDDKDSRIGGSEYMNPLNALAGAAAAVLS